MLGAIGKNIVKKGETVFQKGEKVTQIAIVLSGKVLMQSDWMKSVRGHGTYLALNDMELEEYSASYQALEDSVVYALPARGIESIRDIITKSNDYRAIMISSQYRAAVDMGKIRSDLISRVEKLYVFAKGAYSEYKKICNVNGVPPIEIEELENILPCDVDNDDLSREKLMYYEEAAKIPLNATKAYFSYSEEMVFIQVMDIFSMIADMKQDCLQMVEYIKDIMGHMCFNEHYNLFDFICAKGQEMRKQGEISPQMNALLSYVLDQLTYQYLELKKHVADVPALDVAAMKIRISKVVSKEMTAEEQKSHEEREAQIKRDIISLKNSADQILKFCDFDEAEGEKLKGAIGEIVKASDRLSADDNIKKAKKTITSIFFKVYLACYRKLKEEVIPAPKAVKLFLDYGFMDERLLDDEHIEFLCRIEDEENEGPCNVYTMTQWLELIQDGKREPSKSEFDEDYTENLRTLKKQGEITEAQQKKLMADMDRRVEYEVMNMMTSNMRVIYGQPSTYMPILYKEAIYGYLDKVLVTKKQINECVRRLLEIDYSVFYREVIYSNNQLKIINETIMKNVYPDVILFPVFGLNASMWQEVGGKNKATPGRFCFPIMTNTDIDDMMVKMFGRFRWELCRCIQGMSWNDVKVKSLTSEYMDYIQFYRKNRDLSDDAREKVKLQIQKGRNNSREIFLIDYEAWVKNEANGSMKINKVAREMLATYCPFEKSLREKLGVQRPYEVAMARGIRNNLKKKQEFAQKIKAIQKNTSEIPDEIMDTYNFYANM